jgi:hypothetical protein
MAFAPGSGRNCEQSDFNHASPARRERALRHSPISAFAPLAPENSGLCRGPRALPHGDLQFRSLAIGHCRHERVQEPSREQASAQRHAPARRPACALPAAARATCEQARGRRHEPEDGGDSYAQSRNLAAQSGDRSRAPGRRLDAEFRDQPIARRRPRPRAPDCQNDRRRGCRRLAVSRPRLFQMAAHRAQAGACDQRMGR